MVSVRIGFVMVQAPRSESRELTSLFCQDFKEAFKSRGPATGTQIVQLSCGRNMPDVEQCVTVSQFAAPQLRCVLTARFWDYVVANSSARSVPQRAETACRSAHPVCQTRGKTCFGGP